MRRVIDDVYRREMTVLLRRACPADADAVAAVHVASWRAGYRGMLPDDALDGLSPAAFAARYTFGADDGPVTIVAVSADAIVGFVTVETVRDDAGEPDGHVMALYVAPSSWRRGIGERLLTAGVRLLADQGCRRASLWVMDGNERAEGFYRAHGWRRTGEREVISLHGVDGVPVVRYELDDCPL